MEDWLQDQLRTRLAEVSRTSGEETGLARSDYLWLYLVGLLVPALLMLWGWAA